MSKSMRDHQLHMTFYYTTFVLACDVEENHDDLGIENVGGVFVVLAGGCVVALIIASMDFLWNVEKIAIEEKAIKLRPLLRNNFYRLFSALNFRSPRGMHSNRKYVSPSTCGLL